MARSIPMWPLSLNNIGDAYQDLGKAAEALTYYQRALAILGKVTEHPHVIICLNNIGSVYKVLEDQEKAKEYFERAKAIEEGRKS